MRKKQRKLRLRGLDWFPLPEAAEGRHLPAKKPGEAEGEEAVFACLYLVSIVALPLLIAFFVWHPIDMHDFLYGAPAALAGALPWFMTEAACDLAGRKHYSFFALRTQIWVQLGGAAPSAVRRIRRWRGHQSRSSLPSR